MTPQKKKLLVLSLVLDAVIVAAILFYFFAIPHDKIEQLQKGFVKVEVLDGKANYTQVDKKPKNWASIADISKLAQQAIVISEDWAFYEHEGVDWAQVQKALEDSVKEGKRPRGASTITQQVVKNLYLSNEYSFIRKAQEAVIAHTLDRKLDKKKILEVYLNIAEFGPGIYGIEAAAKHYFGKNAKNLSAKEAAFLAMLLPSPTRYAQSFKEKELSPYARETIANILEKMRMAKFLTPEQVEEALQKAFPWEKGAEEISKPSSPEQQEIADPSKPTPRKKVAPQDGSNVEYDYRVDRELEIDDNPEFDDEAIVDPVEGVDTEFSLE